MRLCEMGIHAYRHVSIEVAPDPLMLFTSWFQIVRCKRCKYQVEKHRARYPIIRSYDWSA